MPTLNFQGRLRRTNIEQRRIPAHVAVVWLCTALLLGCERPSSVDDADLAEVLTLSPEKIDFGELQLGEVVTRVVEIHNSGPSTLHFREPGRDCGCTRAKLETTQLEPGQRTTIEIELRAPPRPGSVTKSVWLSCREFPDSERPIPLAANVTAKAWAEPNAVEIEIPRGGTGTASVVLRHLPSVKIARAACDSSEIEIEMGDSGETSREVTLRIPGATLRRNEIVDDRLLVFLDSDTTPSLQVPVRWRARSKIRFSPVNLMVMRGEDSLRRTVTVLLDPGVPADSLQIAAKLPGIEVVSRRAQGRRVVLSLVVDTHQFSPGRHDAAVRAWTQDGEEEDSLAIVCLPAG